MPKNKKELKIMAPVGEVPSTDRELRARIKKLAKGATVSEVFREVGYWERAAVKKFRKREQTKKSGKLTIHCK